MLPPRSIETVDAWRAREANPAGSMIAPSVRSRAIHSVWKCAARRDASRWSRRPPDRRRRRRSLRELGEILVVAQIYDPKLLIAEFKAPATISQTGQPSSMVVNWSTARSSISDCRAFRKADLVFDDPAIDRVAAHRLQTPLRAPSKSSCTAGLPRNSTPDHPAIETVLESQAAPSRNVHPVLAAPFDADVPCDGTPAEGFHAKTLAAAVS